MLIAQTQRRREKIRQKVKGNSKDVSNIFHFCFLFFTLKSLRFCLSVFLFFTVQIQAQNGKDAKWESAGKQGVGTSAGMESKIWFTLQGGSLTEVFYPTADNANVQYLQLVIVDPKTKSVETERENSIHKIRQIDNGSLSFLQTNTAKTWEIRKTYSVDVQQNSVLIDIQFLPKTEGLELYVFYNPSLKNSGMKDTAWTKNGVFMANEGEIFSAMAVSNGFAEMTNGFFGVSDGLEQLNQFGKLATTNSRAENGNVTQLARIKQPERFTLVLSFGKTETEAMDAAKFSLKKGFLVSQKEYERGWHEYVDNLPKVEAKYQAQLNFAAMILKASEDKTFRGGNVASLSKPWITGSAANDPYVGGYHLVWSRDLYQVATAYMALGDKDAANRALDYLFTIQQKPDGSYPQISWLDGRTLGDSVQMDEVSYPLILAYQLGRNDPETYRKRIKPTADYIIKNGPQTQQERWEEKGGYSPSTIAAEIAGLVCAADIAQKNADDSSARIYLAAADDWAGSVEKWTATKTGKYGGGNYYLRLTQNGKPDAGEKIELNNNGGPADERDIVDAGFLELVRLGIKSPNDELIKKSLKIVDEVLRVETPNGEGFYRYTRDGYGEMDDGRPWNWDSKYTGKGHLWALLSGERGQYEIAECRLRNVDLKTQRLRLRTQDCLAKARSRLDAMLYFGNDGLMIPEQIWDKPANRKNLKFGEGAGSATPLAWSMAQFIRLAINLKKGKNTDTPEVVARRYGNLQ